MMKLIQLLLISSTSRITFAFTTTFGGLTTTITTTHSPNQQASHHACPFHTPATFLYSSNDDNAAARDGGGGNEDDEEGVSLAADFFKAVGRRNIQLDPSDLLEDDDDDEDDDEDASAIVSTDASADDGDDDEEDEEEINIPEGAINAMRDFDVNAQNVKLTNEQVYSELKERVLESAGSFIDLVGNGEDEDDDDEDEEDGPPTPKVYESPTKVPDSELTAGEVVTTVLEALNHNDTPSPNRGIEVLFGYSSPGSAISQAIKVEMMTPAEYGEFLKEENEYLVLFNHEEVIIDKGDYSFDRKKAFFTARLRTGPGPLDFTSVNFILSTRGEEEEDCWLVDSFLIRPEGMRRRRRR